MNVLTIGSAMHDNIIQHKSLDTIYLCTGNLGQSFIILEEGKKLEVGKIGHYSGGGAVNSAVSFSRLGHTVRTLFKTGDDPDRHLILEQLAAENVEPYAMITTESSTGNSFVLPCKSGNRTILVSRGANLLLQLDELPDDALDWCDLVYITSLSQEASTLLPAIVKRVKEHGKIVATNPGSNQLATNISTIEKALQYIDIFILNTFEAQVLMSALRQMMMETQIKRDSSDPTLPELLREPITPATVCFTLHQFFRELLSRGPHTVVVTNGAEGVYAARDNHIYFQPSVPSTVLSTLGAGDAFGSTFVSHLGSGHSIAEAMLAGATNSASVLEYPDAQTGLLTLDSLAARSEKSKPPPTRIFPL